MPMVSIITPTWKRDPYIIDRCIGSVLQQTFTDWEHIICSDGEDEAEVRELVAGKNDNRFVYTIMQPAEHSYGSAVRRFVVGFARGEYCIFLDDDNILFPTYLEKKVNALQQHPEAAMVISQLLHFGPLPAALGLPPQVLSADRPFLQEIDTLQVMIKTAVIAEHEWEDKGYCADGYTYQKIAALYPWISVHEVLSAHL